jgi:hypothetical protein
VQRGTGTLTFTLISESGTSALVSEVFPAVYSVPTLRYTLAEVDGVWYVDDQELGCAATTVYHAAYDSLFTTLPAGQTRPPTRTC